MKNIRYILFAVLIVILSMPIFTFANGGDQRIVERGKYYINLSRAPFTPRVGVKTSFLASFVDIQKNKLISEDLIVNIRISKLGEAPKGNFIFEKNNIPVKGGVLELSYTFADGGLHEIFFDFALASTPEKIYEAPDFLLDVQKSAGGYNANQFLIAILGSFIIGLLGGWFGKRIASRER